MAIKRSHILLVGIASILVFKIAYGLYLDKQDKLDDLLLDEYNACEAKCYQLERQNYKQCLIPCKLAFASCSNKNS